MCIDPDEMTRSAWDLCLHPGARMCVECTWGSDVSTAAGLQLAAVIDPKLLMNVCDLSGYVAPRLDSHALVRHDGRIAPLEGPGLGVAPDLDLLGAPDAVFD